MIPLYINKYPTYLHIVQVVSHIQPTYLPTYLDCRIDCFLDAVEEAGSIFARSRSVQCSMVHGRLSPCARHLLPSPPTCTSVVHNKHGAAPPPRICSTG